MRDRKVGYHWIWLTPILYVSLLVSAGIHKLCSVYAGARMRYLRWRYPEIKKLQHQAGIIKKDT